ncbi:hypothetical protein BN946_scf184841.g3 [Trametes cinnabarina]|uniref:Uncharacterized protein n=1 Tax=Pycnoporus cinnabarinus TaxID=5643 RepID=A0A060SPQ1_PYCCI|nr:hypothetical protein BN946_scf184841.g3 [Trametes cinnabarina]
MPKNTRSNRKASQAQAAAPSSQAAPVSASQSSKAPMTNEDLQAEAIVHIEELFANEPEMDWGGHDHQGHARLVLSWLDTMENLGIARATIEGFEDCLAEMLGDLLRADADEPEFCDPRLLAADRRNRERTMAAIAKEMRRKELLKTSEAALRSFSGTVAMSTEAPVAPSSQMPTNIGYKSKPAAKVMVPGKPRFPLAISSPPSTRSAISLSKRKARSPSPVCEDNIINIDQEAEMTQEVAPPSKKRSRADLPVLHSPTYSRTPSRSLAKAPFRCDRCASTKSANIVCVLREGLPKCDRCFMQFTGCWAQKIPGAKVKSYAEWFDSQGYTRTDAPNAAELCEVMAARGRTSDVPAWTREGAASPTPRTPLQRRGAVPAPASGSQPSVASRPKHRAEVVIVEPPKSTSSARARSIESEDEDIAMDDDSVHAHFATPSPVSRAPSPPLPLLRERSPVAPPVASSASRPAPAPRAGPSLDFTSVQVNNAMHITTPFRARYLALQGQADSLEAQRWAVGILLVRARELRDENGEDVHQRSGRLLAIQGQTDALEGQDWLVRMLLDRIRCLQDAIVEENRRYQTGSQGGSGQGPSASGSCR